MEALIKTAAIKNFELSAMVELYNGIAVVL